MSSKQAVSDVLDHKQPEYIPIGMYAIDCDTVGRIIGHETYVRNKVKTQLALWEGRRDEVAQSLREDSVELFKKLPCLDILIPFKEAQLLPPKGYIPVKPKRLDDKTWADTDGNMFIMSELTNEFALVKSGHVETLDDYPEIVEFTPPDESIFEAYDCLVSAMTESRYIAGISGGFSVLPLPGGMEEGLIKYILEPELIKAAVRYELNLGLMKDQYYIRPGVDGIFIEDDFSTTISPLISPEMFRAFSFPAMSKRVAELKKHRNKVILHSCGHTWPLLDMIAETGVDGYQSLQTGAGMEIGKLKAQYGDRLCFWGGVAVEHLITGTMDEVRADVRRAITEGAGNGGFILGPSHSAAFGTKYDNFMAMIDEHDKLKYSTK